MSLFPRDPQCSPDPEAKPGGTLRSRGNSLFPEEPVSRGALFPEGTVIKCFVILPDSKLEKKLRKNDLLEVISYTGCARKTERLRKPTCPIRKIKVTVFFFAANKKYRQYLSCFGCF